MTARPMTEGERERAVALAKFNILYWHEDEPESESDKGQLLLARALLSTSSAVRGMREALGELLAADDAMAAFIIAVEPAVLGETEWAQQHHERSARRRKAIAKARAALSLEGEDKQARATPSAPISTDTKDATK